MRLELSFEGSTPIYSQIVEQIKGKVASGGLQPGEQLPPLRELAKQLGLNPSTVAKAYAELEREGVIATRRGGGSLVATRPGLDSLSGLREQRLVSVLGRSIFDALSLGFSPEEIEAIFALQMARWRQQRERREARREVSYQASPRVILFVGSHDLTIELIPAYLRRANPELGFSALYTGSLGGLMSLERGEAHLAGCHLLDEETGEYNLPYLRHILLGMEVVLVTLVHRLQGLIVARGNPKRVSGLKDLACPDISFVNRQRGSGTRLLLDYSLRPLGIAPERITGYEHEEETHMAVAAAVASGRADVGLGIYAAARPLGLDFIPLLKERYDLVMLKKDYDAELLQPLLQVLRGDEFKRVVAAMGGYDVEETGRTITLA